MEQQPRSSQEELRARNVNESSHRMRWWVPVIIFVAAGAIASNCGWFVTYFGIVFSSCLPPEVASDSGAVLAFGILSLGLWIVLGVLVVLLGGLLGYVLYRYYRNRPEKPKTIWAAIIFGTSVVACAGITMVVLNQLLCIQ